jgi:hypothetical protein
LALDIPASLENSDAVPGGRMPASTAGETPAATGFSQRPLKSKRNGKKILQLADKTRESRGQFRSGK